MKIGIYGENFNIFIVELPYIISPKVNEVIKIKGNDYLILQVRYNLDEALIILQCKKY